jgi:chloramphenicol 3-O-phosphotransferase
MDDSTLYDLFGSLSREIGALRTETRDGFRRVEARLDRHGGIINGGARQVARLITWSEEMDAMLSERDGRIEELTRRIEKLEGNKPGMNGS